MSPQYSCLKLHPVSCRHNNCKNSLKSVCTRMMYVTEIVDGHTIRFSRNFTGQTTAAVQNGYDSSFLNVSEFCNVRNNTLLFITRRSYIKWHYRRDLFVALAVIDVIRIIIKNKTSELKLISALRLSGGHINTYLYKGLRIDNSERIIWRTEEIVIYRLKAYSKFIFI